MNRLLRRAQLPGGALQALRPRQAARCSCHRQLGTRPPPPPSSPPPFELSAGPAPATAPRATAAASKWRVIDSAAATLTVRASLRASTSIAGLSSISHETAHLALRDRQHRGCAQSGMTCCACGRPRRTTGCARLLVVLGPRTGPVCPRRWAIATRPRAAAPPGARCCARRGSREAR
jgi:hypothetical protein